jgi:hypothetical protein
MMMQSCIGSFALFNKVKNWNEHVGDKFVNEIVFVAMWILPVYELCFTADLLVLNSIEFWSGTNPMAANNIGKTQQVMGQDGRYYAVTTLKNGYEVKAPTGEITYFIHNDENDSWSMEQNGVQKEIFRFDEKGNIQANINGETKAFTLNETGVYQARMIAGDGVFFAMN